MISSVDRRRRWTVEQMAPMVEAGPVGGTAATMQCRHLAPPDPFHAPGRFAPRDRVHHPASAAGVAMHRVPPGSHPARCRHHRDALHRLPARGAGLGRRLARLPRPALRCQRPGRPGVLASRLWPLHPARTRRALGCALSPPAGAGGLASPARGPRHPPALAVRPQRRHHRPAPRRGFSRSRGWLRGFATGRSRPTSPPCAARCSSCRARTMPTARWNRSTASFASCPTRAPWCCPTVAMCRSATRRKRSFAPR